MSPQVDYDALAAQARNTTPPPAPPAPTTQQTAPVDYDALAAQARNTAQPTVTPQPTYMQGVQSRVTGLAQGMEDLMLPADKLIHKVPGVGEWLAPQAMIDREQARVSGNSPAPDEETAGGREVGHELGSQIEFELGDKLLGLAKGVVSTALDLPTKLQELGKLGTVMKNYPGLARGLHLATVAGTQTAIHGGSAGEVAGSALATGVLGTAAEGAPKAAQKAGEIIESVKPTTSNIEGADVPEFRDQTGTGRPGVITRTTDPDIAQAQQAGAQQAFRNSATRATQRILDRFGMTADPVTSFGQGVQQAQEKLSGVYDQLDDATQGMFRKLNGQIQDAKTEVFESVGKAKVTAQKRLVNLSSQMEGLFNNFDDANFGQAARSAADKARAGFHDTYDMDTIHRYLNKAFNIESPETAATTTTPYTMNEAPTKGASPQPPTVRRASMSNQLNNLEKELGTGRLSELLGPDGAGNLHNLARITNNPAQVEAARGILRDVLTRATTKGSVGGSIGGLIGHFMGGHWAEGATAGFTLGAVKGGSEGAVDRLLHYAATSPRIGNMLSYAVRHNIGGKYASGLIAAAIQQDVHPLPATPPPPPPPKPGEDDEP